MSQASGPIGRQIRGLREARGWSLAELARRAGTSAPTLHRYENGWDRFELATLRRIAAALQARLDVRLVGQRLPSESPRPGPEALLELLEPLFWDCDPGDPDQNAGWILARTLVFGNRRQATAARRYFGDEALREALMRRDVDGRTRAYWNVILADRDGDPSRSTRCTPRC